MVSSALDLDMHAVGEAFAGVMACRNFQNSTVLVEVAAEDPEAGTASADLEAIGNRTGRSNRLDVLGDAGDADARKLLELTEDRVPPRVDLIRRRGKVGVNISIGRGDRSRSVRAGADSAEPRPRTACRAADFLGEFLGQSNRSGAMESKPRVARILKDFANVGQRLVEGSAPRSCGLDDRARSAAAGDQAFGLENAQRFANGESADGIFGAQHALGREGVDLEFTTEDLLAKVVGKLDVARLARAGAFNCRAVRHFTSLGLRSR